MGLRCACFNLRRASRAVTQLYDRHFEEVGLKATQFSVLAALAHAQAEKRQSPPTIGALAEMLVLEQSSLSRNLAVLERLGLVRLEPGVDDRRERIVRLARAGTTALARGYPIWQRAQAAIAAAWGGRDLEAQLRSLRRITTAAQELHDARGGGRRKAKERGRPSMSARP